ncbi:hypothetical protein PTMSG1_07400 [Pyrenophora teres f. maculata]|nr:hypothetical protein PTMSG1_07400 [Pyrenophora teres f. maculata]
MATNIDMPELSFVPRYVQEMYAYAPFRHMNFAYKESARINQLNSPFLRLPAELRNNIYEYYFSDSIAIIKNTTHGGDNGTSYKNRCDNTCPLNLLEASRQIHHEASPLFWSLATFGAQHGTTAKEIKSLLGLRKCALITKLCREDTYMDWSYSLENMEMPLPPVVGVPEFRSLRSVCILMRRYPSHTLRRLLTNVSRYEFGNVEISFFEDKALEF